MTTASQHPGLHLRTLFERETVMCPGAFNALVARAIAQAGFQACYISGGATANSAGYPDIGLITLTEMARTIREIVRASGLPVIVDADTGYGEVERLHRTTIEYEGAGAAGMHIEDQVFPKRCGHLDGKTLIPTSDMVEKVRAACESRRSSGALIIIARTDARSVEGMDAAVERANAYRAAGADMIFPEGLQTEEEFAAFAKRSPGLLLANMTEFGKSPMLNQQQLRDMGYQLVIYPLSMQRIAMAAVIRALDHLKSEGSVADLVDTMQSRAALYDLLGYTPGVEWPFPSPSSQRASVSRNQPEQSQRIPS
ncbi:MAG: isocitrate lyase/PEP mutase family protein [Phycisphaerales bacterium]